MRNILLGWNNFNLKTSFQLQKGALLLMASLKPLKTIERKIECIFREFWKKKLHSWKFCRIVSHSFGNHKTRNQDPWKFQMTFYWSPLEILLLFHLPSLLFLHAIFSIPLEIPSTFFFYQNIHYNLQTKKT